MAKTYGVCAIGVSWGSKIPIPAIAAHSRTKLVVLVARREESLTALTSNFNCDGSTDYRTAIAREDVDIVYVGSPVALHSEMVLCACLAGKHIICEKPLSTNSEESLAMLSAIRDAQVEATCTFTLRFFDAFLEVKRLVDSGVIGELRHVTANFFLGQPADAPGFPYSSLHDKEKGGGVILAMGAHYIDYLQATFGQRFTSVRGESRIWTKSIADAEGVQREVTAEDALSALLTFQSGALVTLNITGSVRIGPPPELAIYGDKGTIVLRGTAFTKFSLQIAEDTDKVMRELAIPARAMPEAGMLPHLSRFAFLLTEMVQKLDARDAVTDTGAEAARQIQEGSPTEASQMPTFQEALSTQRVLDALAESAENGGKVVQVVVDGTM